MTPGVLDCFVISGGKLANNSVKNGMAVIGEDFRDHNARRSGSASYRPLAGRIASHPLLRSASDCRHSETFAVSRPRSFPAMPWARSRALAPRDRLGPRLP